jgi:hypothetical protein
MGVVWEAQSCSQKFGSTFEKVTDAKIAGSQLFPHKPDASIMGRHHQQPPIGICTYSIHTALCVIGYHQSRRGTARCIVHGTSTRALTLRVQEVKLSTTNAERDLYDSLAEIYSIIITLDALEKAYLKDSITEVDYTGTCSRLLKQYKSNLANETVARAFGDLDSFIREWHVRHKRLCLSSCANKPPDGMS